MVIDGRRLVWSSCRKSRKIWKRWTSVRKLCWPRPSLRSKHRLSVLWGVTKVGGILIGGWSYCYFHYLSHNSKNALICNLKYFFLFQFSEISKLKQLMCRSRGFEDGGQTCGCKNIYVMFIYGAKEWLNTHRSRQTQAEVVKLKRIQKELQALDDMVSNDIGILRSRIDQASWDYAAAR